MGTPWNHPYKGVLEVSSQSTKISSSDIVAREWHRQVVAQSKHGTTKREEALSHYLKKSHSFASIKLLSVYLPVQTFECLGVGKPPKMALYDVELKRGED